MSWIATNARHFDFENFEKSTFNFYDGVRALSKICRFNGHTKRFYSVAEHSIWVSHYVPQKYAMHGLLHDFHEAFIGDVTTPLKMFLPDFREFDKRAQKYVLGLFGIDELHESVKEIDSRILLNEREQALDYNNRPWNDALEAMEPLPNLKLSFHDPDIGYQLFRKRFEEIIHRQKTPLRIHERML